MRIDQMNTNYDQIASIYNSHFGQVSIAKFFPVLEKLFFAKLPLRAKVLDLCCGTGQIASIASSRRFKVTGIDLSENMLGYARENAPKAKFAAGDIKDLSLTEKYSGIYSLFNGVNNVFDEETLKSLFETVFASLDERGIFFFDVDDENGFKSKWKGSIRIESPHGYYFVKMNYDKESSIGKSYITLVSEKERPSYAEVEIAAKCFPISRIKSALDNAGFKQILTYRADRDLNIPDETGRVFFVCHK